MKCGASTRPYRMRARAEAAERTARAVLEATAALWRERALNEITLGAIGERAGVSVRTVLRRFGSRDGVIEATIEAESERMTAERDRAIAGDVDGALDHLLRHYERDGDAVLRTLALEETMASARAIAGAGRAAHRSWCARVFAPYLPDRGDAAYEARLDAFVAATDLYLWKLLRRDLGRTAEEAGRVFRSLLAGLTGVRPESG